MSKDYYKTLGVNKNATEAEIKAAFRKLAHEHHPDKNKGDDKKFKEINEAYQTLSNKQKRAQYDQFGSAGPGGFGGGQQYGGFNGNFGGMDFNEFMRQAQAGGFQGGAQFDFGDIDLGDLFGAAFGFGGGRVRRGRNVEIQVKLTFKESVRGISRELDVPDYRDGKQHGTKKLRVDIPAGVEHGQQLRVDDAGETLTDGRPGYLIITVIVDRHPTIRKDGNNLIMDLHVSLADALLGKTIEVETLDGKEKVVIPECMPVGTILKIKGKGVSGGFMRTGDFLIVTHIDMPKKLSKDVKKIIEDLKKEL